ATGATLRAAARELERIGVPESRLVLMLALMESGTVPDGLDRHPSVLLPWERWSVHRQLEPSAVAASVAALRGEPPGSWRAQRLPLAVSGPERSHASARYRVWRADAVDEDVEASGAGAGADELFVKGTGLGYYGDHAVAV